MTLISRAPASAPLGITFNLVAIPALALVTLATTETQQNVYALPARRHVQLAIRQLYAPSVRTVSGSSIRVASA
jgi:hypothetical protein